MVATSKWLQTDFENLEDIVEAVEQVPAAPQRPYIELGTNTAKRMGVKRIVRRRTVVQCSLELLLY